MQPDGQYSGVDDFDHVMVMMMSPSEVTLWIRLTKMMITRRNIGESKELAGMAIFVDIAWQHSIG